ncbi:MAG: sulfite exporter TauE/SafE family protein [Litorivicinus sp.]
MLIALYALTGVFAGFSAGLFGVGGGLVVVPVLLALFAIKGIDPSAAVHLAIGTSLATIVVTSISSTLTHRRRGNVDWGIFKRYGSGLVLGAIIGAITADLTPGPILRVAFGIFCMVMAAQLAFGGQPKPGRALPGWRGLSGAGLVVGWISSLFGIAGGGMTVPYLLFHNVKTKLAVGTSAAAGFPIAVTGAIGYYFTGLDNLQLPPYSAGYLYMPAFISIVVLSIPTAKLGAEIASRLDPLLLKRCFAGFLFSVGCVLVFGG